MTRAIAPFDMPHLTKIVSRTTLHVLPEHPAGKASSWKNLSSLIDIDKGFVFHPVTFTDHAAYMATLASSSMAEKGVQKSTPESTSEPLREAPESHQELSQELGQASSQDLSSQFTEEEVADVEDEEPTEDELFERVFGRPRPRSQAVKVPFFIDDQEQGQIIVLVDGGSASQVQASPFLERTEGIVQPAIQAQLSETISDQGYLKLEAIRQLGIVVIFDQSRLELELQVPPTLRQTNVIDPRGLPPEAARALSPSAVSGYINLRGAQDVIWQADGAGDTGRQPLRLNVDGAFNVSGWVLEGRFDWLEDGNPAFTRGDVRLVHDDPDHALRYVLGDLSIPVTGFYQAAVPLGGLSVSRNYDLQPYRVTRPAGEFTFFLERPATVDVLVNGIRVQQLRLQAGPQDIRNLSLSTGINDIQLIITDDLGQVQRLDFSTAVAGNLLSPGLEQFSYSLGFPYELVSGKRDYEMDTPLFSGSYRMGVTDHLTIGGYAQARPDYQLLGTEGIAATTIGNFGWEVAASHADDLGADVAARFQYEWLGSGASNSGNRTFRTAVEYRGVNFTTSNAIAPSDYSVDLSAFYSQKILDNVNFNLSGSYRLGRDDPNTYNAYLGLSRSFDNGLNGNLNWSYRRNLDGEEEVQAFLGLSWIFPRKRQSLSLNTEVSNADEMSTRLSWSLSPSRTVQSLGTSVDLSHDADSYDVNGRLDYTNYRFELGVAQDLSFADGSNGDQENTSQFTFGTALVFAGGRFGWSRPITNSFVLVAPRRNWRDQKIRVNPRDDGALAMVDDWGAAVLTDVRSYYLSDVWLDAPEAPLGYDLGEFRHIVLPTYRSGTLILAGTDASVLIRGTLMDTDGEPVSLDAGEVVSLSDPHWPTQILFTNRVGRFALPGFKPGQYEIRLGDRVPIAFEIPKDQEGLYELGTMHLAPE